MRMRALQRLGHQVLAVNTVEPWRQASWLQRQTQRRLQRGSVIHEINHWVLAAAREFKPHIVWADKQEYLSVETLHDLRTLGPRLLHFTPDPYFSLPWKRTSIMDEAISAFDVLLYCKSYEREQYQALNRCAIYMPLGYCDETHRPLPSNDLRWCCDVGFLGGWEPRRESLLGPVAKTGLNLKIWGSYWDFLQDGRWSLRRKVIMNQLAGGIPYAIHRRADLAAAWQGDEVYGDDYARALTGSKISTGFLRETWPDQHTTRTFEIPACGSMLLADRTPEHQEFFEEGKEAEFFESGDELLDKIRFYISNESARRRIVESGLERCHRAQYSYLHRIAAIWGEAMGD